MLQQPTIVTNCWLTNHYGHLAYVPGFGQYNNHCCYCHCLMVVIVIVCWLLLSLLVVVIVIVCWLLLSLFVGCYCHCSLVVIVIVTNKTIKMETLLLFVIVIVCWLLLFPSVVIVIVCYCWYCHSLLLLSLFVTSICGYCHCCCLLLSLFVGCWLLLFVVGFSVGWPNPGLPQLGDSTV